MKFANLLYASFVAVIAICANAINSQQQRENSLLQFNSAADVRSYFEDIATAKTDAELLKRYPLIAKGNAIPIRNGGQIIVDGDSLRTKDKDGHTIEMPSNGTALVLNQAYLETRYAERVQKKFAHDPAFWLSHSLVFQICLCHRALFSLVRR
jgi:hypothetical protein